MDVIPKKRDKKVESVIDLSAQKGKELPARKSSLARTCKKEEQISHVGKTVIVSEPKEMRADSPLTTHGNLGINKHRSPDRKYNYSNYHSNQHRDNYNRYNRNYNKY